MFLPWLAWAQAGSTGAIGGVARDATGAVLPGVTVEAASPALIEKVCVAVTDDQGRYLITDLRPGPYAVTFSLTGFSSLRREGIEITTGFTATANADLRIGVLEETVTVTGASPVVDVQNVRTQTAVGREVLDDIPGARTLAGLAKLTVGATGGTNDVGGNKGEGSVGTIHGTGAGQTMVDGLRITNPVATGTARRQAINQLSVEEVVLEYAGAYAESESGGFNVNFVTKSGGNTLSGAFSGDLSGDAPVFMPQHAPALVGRDVVRVGYAHVFDTIKLSIRFDVHEVQEAGDWAWARASSAGRTRVLSTGADITKGNNELFVFRREKGSWKIHRYLFSTNQPPRS